MSDFAWPPNCRRDWTFTKADDLILHRLGHIARMIHHQGEEMALNFERTTRSLAALKSVEEGIVALLAELSGELHAAAGDQGAVDAIADTIDARAAEFANAITINTPPIQGGQIPDPTPPVDEPAPEPPVVDEPPAVEPAPESDPVVPVDEPVFLDSNSNPITPEDAP